MTKIMPEPAPVHLLIGHWKKGLAREEQHPPILNLGPLTPFRKCSGALDRCSRFVYELKMDSSSPITPELLPPMPGQRLARGVCRALREYDFVTVEEFIPAPGLRVDVLALGPKGEVWVVECKSGRADYQTDRKWQGYLDWCDRFFWAVDADFPTDLLPEHTGLILADAYDAEILRMGPETPLASARRKALMHKFARHAASRLHALRDPGVQGLIL